MRKILDDLKLQKLFLIYILYITLTIYHSIRHTLREIPRLFFPLKETPLILIHLLIIFLAASPRFLPPIQ